MKYLKQTIIILSLTMFALPSLVSAIKPQEAFQQTVGKAEIVEDGANIPDISTAIGKGLNQLFLYIGVVTMVLIVYAGALWATAAGNEKRVGQAKKILIGSVIGLIIVFTAAGVVNFVLSDVLSDV